MTLPRMLQILLLGLLVGLLPLRAGDPLAPGGDGGVVILPNGYQISSDITAYTTSHGIDDEDRARETLDLEHEMDVIRLRLPANMITAYAVMFVSEQSIVMPLPVIAGNIEIEVEMLMSLAELGIDGVDLLVVSAGRVLRLRITIEEVGDVDKEREGQEGQEDEADEEDEEVVRVSVRTV